MLNHASEERLRAATHGTRWCNEELLFHILFGYLITRALLPLVHVLSRMPPAVSRGFTAVLNIATGPFDLVNYYGSRGGARVINHHRMGRVFDRVIADLHRRLDAETDATLIRSMAFPTRWDPFFLSVMTGCRPLPLPRQALPIPPAAADPVTPTAQ